MPSFLSPLFKFLTNNPIMNRLFNFSLHFKNCSKNIHSLSYWRASDRKLSSSSDSKGNVVQFAEAYRNHGYKIAVLNPLIKHEERYVSFLDPAKYGLDITNLQKIPGETNYSVQELIQHLKQIYCDKIGVEIQHLEEEERSWFISEFESLQTDQKFSVSEQKDLAVELIKSQVFEKFLATKFSSVKRYGGEGAESMLAFFIEIFNLSANSNDLKDVFIGIPHRGRLALLTGLLKFPPVAMFQKMKGFSELPADVNMTGDVLSHLTSSEVYEHNNSSVHVTMLPNPSHLEAVSPVVAGYARSRLQNLKAKDYATKNDSESNYPVLPIQVHGDASFSGQGVVMETLAISKVPNFNVGGSVHLIVNNQIGFTTPQERGSSSENSSDLMKMISAPVIHVNGDSPEDVAKAARLAFCYRQKFKKDVLVDMICFRRWGHNEMDDPTFTNPLMYKVINSRKSVPDLYADSLIDKNVITKEELKTVETDYWNFLNESLKQTETYKTMNYGISKYWKKNEQLRKSITTYDSGVDIDLLKYLGLKSVQLPKNFVPHSTLSKNFIQERIKKISKGTLLDWATAESLALSSLIYQGHNVRISGQDVGRGTFNHRHVMMFDQANGETYIPLNHLTEEQTSFLEVANSILSEEGVLSFEYGFSVENTDNLVLWEAQFGDFFNSAQVVFDTFISSGETKWLLPSRIVILLPHGYDGAGPEHSSCRLERFLQMCNSCEDKIDSDDVNWHVVNPTTPAQYFHLLRQQMITDLQKPLIVVAPKILLRHPRATSAFSELAPGTCFESVLEETVDSVQSIKKVIVCSGKHYYLLQKEKETRKLNDCAIIRIEKLCPFPVEEIYNAMKKYTNAKNFVWSQEEPQNMGAWSFIQTRFRNLLGQELKYAGRRPLAAPAVGIGKIHEEEIKQILNNTFT